MFPNHFKHFFYYIGYLSHYDCIVYSSIFVLKSFVFIQYEFFISNLFDISEFLNISRYSQLKGKTRIYVKLKKIVISIF